MLGGKRNKREVEDSKVLDELGLSEDLGKGYYKTEEGFVVKSKEAERREREEEKRKRIEERRVQKELKGVKRDKGDSVKGRDGMREGLGAVDINLRNKQEQAERYKREAKEGLVVYGEGNGDNVEKGNKKRPNILLLVLLGLCLLLMGVNIYQFMSSAKDKGILEERDSKIRELSKEYGSLDKYKRELGSKERQLSIDKDKLKEEREVLTSKEKGVKKAKEEVKRQEEQLKVREESNKQNKELLEGEKSSLGVIREQLSKKSEELDKRETEISGKEESSRDVRKVEEELREVKEERDNLEEQVKSLEDKLKEKTTEVVSGESKVE